MPVSYPAGGMDVCLSIVSVECFQVEISARKGQTKK